MSPDVREAERLEDLRQLGFLYADRCDELKKICQITQTLLGADLASINLVESEHLRFLTIGSAEGLLPRAGSYCNETIKQADVFEIPDILDSPYPLVPEHLRAMQPRHYAGVPLALRPGVNIGTLCVINFEARRLSPEQQDLLRTLGGLVLDQMRLYINTEALRRRSALLDQASRLARIGAWELDLDERQVKFNDGGYAILQRDPSAPIPMGMMLDDIRHEDDRRRVIDAIQRVREGGESLDIEVEIGAAAETSRWIRLLGAREERDGRTIALFGAVQDVTERRRADERIQHLAHHDALTGLPNRALFNQRFGEALDKAGPAGNRVGLVLIDFDHFKRVNDSRGHAAGDALLETSAERLVAAVGKDGTVARLGGDEFAIILTEVASPADLMARTDALSALIKQPIPFEGEALEPSASLGATLFPDDHHRASDLMKNADIALYLAKSAGRGRPAYFMPELRRAYEERVALSNDVRRGVSAGEFELHYQPICTVEKGEAPAVAGFEALMRWRHPRRGLLLPAQFSPAFEESELATALGDMALEEVVAQMEAWRRAGLAFGYVSLNVAEAQFQSPGFFAAVSTAVQCGRVKAGELVLEITESVYLGSDPARLGDELARLHALGVRIALDDFGTGYASLSHLQQFPVDVLKVDRSFIDRIGGRRGDAAIAQAVINLGRALGMEVVAEGVESAEQSAFLTLSGCNRMQGFLFAKALEPGAVPGFMESMAATPATALSVAS